ncbi:hypothetical protein C8R46DRAFT_34570 [Mycena filopes]|nr:hypothetical protein C8R46DRAFT_34570 [Mycena filopes]
MKLQTMYGRRFAIVTFVDPAAPQAFLDMTIQYGLYVHDQQRKIGWAPDPGPLAPQLAIAARRGATRTLFISLRPLKDGTIRDRPRKDFTRKRIESDFASYSIERASIVQHMNCAMMSFTTLKGAVRAFSSTFEREEYRDLLVQFLDDRCAGPLVPAGAEFLEAWPDKGMISLLYRGVFCERLCPDGWCKLRGALGR